LQFFIELSILLTYDSDIAILSLYVTFRYSIEMTHGFFMIAYLSIFMSIKQLREILTGHPCEGAIYRWGIKISRFSTSKSLSRKPYKIAP